MGWNSFIINILKHSNFFKLMYRQKTVKLSKLVNKKAVPSHKSWKGHLYKNFIFWLHILFNLILVNCSVSKWNKKWTRMWIWEFRWSKSEFQVLGRKVHFSLENGTSFSIENLGTYISIFHNFKNWVSFSHHFWIIQLML